MDLSPEKICKNFGNLKSSRTDFDSFYQILHNYYYVEGSNITSKKNKGSQINTLLDATSLCAGDVLASGLANYLTPEASKWVFLQHSNPAYAFVSTISWPNAVSKMCDNLTNMGFDEKEAENSLEPELQQMNLEFNFEKPHPAKYTFVSKTDISKLSEETKQILELEVLDDGTASVKIGYDTPENAISELGNAIDKKDIPALEKTLSVLKSVIIKKFPSERGEIIEVPQLKLFVDGKWELAEKEMFLPNGWDLLGFPAILDDSEFCIRDDGRTVEIDIEGKRIVERFYQNTLSLNLENVETNWSNSDLSRWIDRKMYQPDITMPVKLEFVRRIVEYLNLQKGISLSTLIMRKFLLLKAVENKINGCRKKAYAKGYQTSLFENSGNVKTDFDYKFKFDKYYPAGEKYTGRKRFNKHFYPIIADMNGEEAECAAIMDSLAEIKYWVRNLEHHPKAFSLPTSTDKFYPDFVALLNDGRLYVIEYKGGDRVSNDDSKEKDNIGKLWAEKSSGQCLFKMVTDEKTAGKSILNQIKEEL
ncbi:MAG: hypothetical protein LUG16_03030 [Candidatus Gastranaerophilales bacterium]|nr:hypothetical protein [Candidatus Gastranaerophilales bacterium]